MDLAKYYNPIAAVAVWAAVFLIIKPKRIKRLLPVGIYGLILMLAIELIAKTVGNYKFTTGLVMVAGTPLFHFPFGLGSVLLVAHFLGLQKDFNMKLLVILIFAVIDQMVFLGAVLVGNVSVSPHFPPLAKMFRDVMTLSFFAFTAEGWFGRMLTTDYKNKIS